MTEVTQGAGRNRSTPVPSDVELLEGIRAGDPNALEALMARYWPPLVRYAENVMSGVGDPQDVVQEGFVRLWARREDWDREGSLKALLYTIVRNAALDERRRRDRGDRVTRERAHFGAPNPTPYENVQGAELKRAAAAAVAALPPKRQEVFRLAREEGLSYREIGAAMGISTQTVANQMSLALADLRLAMKPYLAGTAFDTREKRRSGQS